MSAIETIKQSVETSSMVRYGKQSIDYFSAQHILALWEKLSPDSREQYEKIMEENLLKAASIAFKIFKKFGAI